MADVKILERPVYGFTQVDALLSLPAGTARRWVDGYDRAGKHYEPVVREHTTGDPTVTWGEFVETSFLAHYRDVGVPMLHLRPAVERWRVEFGRYPLARLRPYALGRDLVAAVQRDVKLPYGLAVVEKLSNGQLVLTPRAVAFLSTTEFDKGVGAVLADNFARVTAELYGDLASGDALEREQDVVLRIAPAGAENVVRFDPDYGFGEPTVRGRNVRTDVLAEAVRAGDSIEAVADAWALSIEAVRQAVDWEQERRAA